MAQTASGRQRVHEILTGRGWRLDAADLDAGWEYPGSFGGQRCNPVADATPVPLQAYFSYGDDGAEVFCVVPAGNLHGSGCAEHDTAEQVVAVDGVAALLDDLESRAATHDLRALIECRYFGPC
ncbi:hypothetical protein VA596_30090 [Amycolatopsis sp., V23-08]|uniref:Uncharacterized protein n=1 Tax=Amycolatopsis heterodermiae TaxID=3110235 RepID=A0ABU5RC32_9PSEU|nr:hypothetical protein [Amycolatopsis sp., V23-08]MEA5363818.1 hypothetical protein [Amycolatopsis sp., V23-08]